MSHFDEDTIKNLGKLCRLKISDEETSALCCHLKRVVDYIELLEEVDVSDLSPYSHLEEQGEGSLRKDVVGETLSRETFLSNASEQIGGMIRVPPVIKQTP